jgi:hypothetical protein
MTVYRSVMAALAPLPMADKEQVLQWALERVRAQETAA